MVSTLPVVTTSSELDHDNAMFGSERVSLSTAKSSVTQEKPLTVSVNVCLCEYAHTHHTHTRAHAHTHTATLLHMLMYCYYCVATTIIREASKMAS